MSSWRKAMPRREHKERSQPASRKHLGLLEKKKDYIERARDFQKKVGHITDLKKKGKERNPDEFYFGMLNSKTQNGVHEAKRKDGLDKLTHTEVQLMKDQDIKYLGMKQSMDERKAERLQEELHFMLEKPLNKHTIYLDSEEQAATFDPAKHFGTDPKLAGRAFNRVRKVVAVGHHTGESIDSAEESGGILVGPTSMKQLKKVMKQREKSYKELYERLERSDKLKRLVLHKQVEKNVMAKGSKRKIKEAEDGAPAVYKWKRQRSR
jgi:U3 small nucleolar RNA-associated protein 11